MDICSKLLFAGHNRAIVHTDSYQLWLRMYDPFNIQPMTTPAALWCHCYGWWATDNCWILGEGESACFRDVALKGYTFLADGPTTVNMQAALMDSIILREKHMSWAVITVEG